MPRLLFCSLLFLTCFVGARPASAADDAVAMAIDLFMKDDAEFRAIGLDRIRHAVKGDAATKRFASLLATLPPARQIELSRALADRGDKGAIPAITALLATAQDPAARSAAVAALGVLGGGPEVAVLRKSLTANDPEKAAARRALTILRGDDAIAQLIAAAGTGEPAVRAKFIEILCERRTQAARPLLTKACADADATVRMAALRGLGKLGGPDQVTAVIAALTKAAPGGERDEAERTAVAICTQNTGAAAATAAFLAAFKQANDGDREILLPALGRIGGPGALAIIDELIASPDASRRAFGLRAISRWPDATVASRLLDLVGKATNDADRDMLVAALIRIAPLPDNKLDDKGKLDLVQKTMALCRTDAERARLLERANAIRTIETFRFVVPYLDTPALAEPACRSVVELAHHRQLRDANKDEFMKALDRVIATTRNPELVERANRYKEGKTWERKKG